HADDGWFEMIGRKYADSCHFYADNNYFTEMNNGVTQGAAWYTVEGSRQDYMNFYQHCREATIELSLNKIPDSTVLSQLWRYN
ncbi:MAG: M14 family zinc carboxypeptidase, partial [Bacteroidales bacterium]